MKEFYINIDSLITEHPEYSRDEAFTFWFIHYLTLNEKKADSSLTGVSGDKGIDALWIDDEAQVINILQAKLREKWGKHTEKRQDVLDLSNLVKIFRDKNEKEQFFKGLDAKIVRKLEGVIERVNKRKYKIELYYITTGKVSKNLRDEAKASFTNEYSYQIFDYEQLELAWEDWVEGVAPAVGSYELGVETSNFSRAIINKTEGAIESWITTSSSKEIGQMYKKTGKVLFAKNIRGFLGEGTAINEDMKSSLENEPGNFWYYNNGITIVCDNCIETTSGGKTRLKMTRPQVINGQQTTRTLAEHPHVKAHVLVKVFKVPRKGNFGFSSYHEIVNNIVKATNWQNKISYSDLISNEPEQVSLGMEFRKLKYQYLRKKEKKSEARDIGFKPIMRISKEGLAKNVAACIIDPLVARLSGDKLFTKEHYCKIFKNPDVSFYISCELVERFVSLYKKNVPKKYRSYYSKWLIIHLIWHNIGTIIEDGNGARKFRELWNIQKRSGPVSRKTYKDEWECLDYISKIVVQVNKLTKNFYKQNRKTKDGVEIDESTFFRRSDVWREFIKFSKTKNKKENKKLKLHFDGFKKGLMVEWKKKSKKSTFSGDSYKDYQEAKKKAAGKKL